MALLLLRADDELRGLEAGAPELVDASAGLPTGIRLTRRLNAGATAVVFLAELNPERRGAAISPLAPRRLVIKFIKPETERHLRRIGLELLDIARRETTALNLVMGRHPPTEFIISLYGSGSAEVLVGEQRKELPWLALEFVDGGSAGATLADRIQRTPEGVDPVRALRLVRGMIEGVKVFHELDILHRDLKPENVFVAGPLDDETPKIADCGIARVEGLAGLTIAGMTPEYGGPEQTLWDVRPTERNPLVGRWTDVHALAATVWFVLTGESWCRMPSVWSAGQRRSLRTASQLHRGLLEAGPLIDALDAVLQRGAAHRLPEEAWQREGAAAYERVARQRFGASMFGAGPARHPTIGDFEAALLPLLEQCAARWVERAGRENRPATQFRATKLLDLTAAEGLDARAEVRELPAAEALLRGGLPLAAPEGVTFLPGYGSFVRFGERLLYMPLTGQSPTQLPVPPEHQRAVSASRWLVRGPGMGIALLGPRHVLLLRRGRFESLPLPLREGGGEVGEIQAVVGDGRLFGVVTAETDDSSGGPELWRSADGATWSGPTLLPLGGDAHALAYGPFGLLVAGSCLNKRGERKARALFLSLDEQTQVFAAGVTDKPKLTVAVAGAGREMWAAGAGILLRFDPPGGSTPESVEVADPPLAMGLDLVGVPWLVTERAVLRRYEGGGSAVWKRYCGRDAEAAPFVGIGFTPEGARVLDARGGGVLVVPEDVKGWR